MDFEANPNCEACHGTGECVIDPAYPHNLGPCVACYFAPAIAAREAAEKAARANREHWAASLPSIPYIDDAEDRTNYLLNEHDRLTEANDAGWAIAKARLASIERLSADVDHLKRREADVVEACKRVADGGQYRADIVSAIQRIRRERDEGREKATAVRTVLLDGFPPNIARAEPWNREEMGVALSRMVKAAERAVAMLDEMKPKAAGEPKKPRTVDVLFDGGPCTCGCGCPEGDGCRA